MIYKLWPTENQWWDICPINRDVSNQNVSSETPLMGRDWAIACIVFFSQRFGIMVRISILCGAAHQTQVLCMTLRSPPKMMRPSSVYFPYRCRVCLGPQECASRSCVTHAGLVAAWVAQYVLLSADAIKCWNESILPRPSPVPPVAASSCVFPVRVSETREVLHRKWDIIWVCIDRGDIMQQYDCENNMKEFNIWLLNARTWWPYYPQVHITWLVQPIQCQDWAIREGLSSQDRINICTMPIQ